MAAHLKAGCVYTSDEDDVVMVGFADQQYGARRYLLLQRARSVSEEERARGEDTVYLEVDGERSEYDAIESIVVERTAAMVVLQAESAARLKTDQEILVSFRNDDHEYSQLLDGLRALWEHRPEALVIKS